jgi:WD40 repeat protein
MDVDRRPIRTIAFPSASSSGWDVQQTGAGLRFISPTGDETLRVLDETGKVLLRLNVRHDGVKFSPDGTRLAVIVDDDRFGGFALFEAASGKWIADCVGHKGQLFSLSFSPDGTRVASAGEEGVARVWNVATGAKFPECRGHTSKILSVAFRPDGARLVTASFDGTVRQWNPTTGAEVGHPFEHHPGEIITAVYRPDGEWIASGGADRTIWLWRAEGRHEVAVLHGHTGAVLEVAFTADGRRLVSLSQNRDIFLFGDNTVGTWDIEYAADLPVLRGHTRYVYPVACSPDGRWIASGSWDQSIRLWDAVTGEACAKLPQPGVVWALAFSPDGTWLVSGCDKFDELILWDVATARERGRIRGMGMNLRSVAVSPDGTRIATSNPEGQMEHSMNVWDVATGQRVWTGKGLPYAYSPDGKWLAGWDPWGTNVVLWDTRDFRQVASWPGHTGDMNAVAFSRDGTRLVSASSDRTVRVWDTATGRCLRTFTGHSDQVFTAAFHPDGKRVASAGRDRAIQIWDPTGDQEGVRLPGHTTYVWSLAFSPAGESLVSGSGDGTVRLWDTEPLARRYQARHEIDAVRPEAARLVRRLFAELREPDQVISRLRDDGSLSAPLRYGAMQEVMRPRKPD